MPDGRPDAQCDRKSHHSVHKHNSSRPARCVNSVSCPSRPYPLRPGRIKRSLARSLAPDGRVTLGPAAGGPGPVYRCTSTKSSGVWLLSGAWNVLSVDLTHMFISARRWGYRRRRPAQSGKQFSGLDLTGQWTGLDWKWAVDWGRTGHGQGRLHS